MKKQKTCGMFYQEAIKEYGTTTEAYRAFAAGFIHGQAEKVYIGACKAAMFRPSKINYRMAFDISIKAAKRYSLIVGVLDEGDYKEIWIVNVFNMHLFRELETHERNTKEWHKLRGELCGIPAENIDVKFHEREGYGKDVD